MYTSKALYLKPASIITRRSTRKYLDKEVSQELLEKIIETGRYAPSGGNSQSNHFLVIQNKQIIDHLVKMVERAFSQMEIQSIFLKRADMYFVIMHLF